MKISRFTFEHDYPYLFLEPEKNPAKMNLWLGSDNENIKYMGGKSYLWVHVPDLKC